MFVVPRTSLCRFRYIEVPLKLVMQFQLSLTHCRSPVEWPKTSKRLRIYHASYLVIQNTMEDAKNKSLWTKTNTESARMARGLLFSNSQQNFSVSLSSFWQRNCLDFFIKWTLVWVLSVCRSHDISISLEKRLQVNEQLNVVYSRLSAPGSLRDKYINNSNLPIKLYRYLPLRSSPKYKHTSRNRANQQRIQATTWPQEGEAGQEYFLCLSYKETFTIF